MKKGNRIFYLGLLTLVLALVTTSLVSGTFAKYVTTASGTGTVTVAKWAVTINGVAATTETTSPTFTFDLGSTTDPNVVALDKVAPGSQGSFALTCDTDGTQVAHSVSVTLNKGDGNDIAELEFFEFNTASDFGTGTKYTLGTPISVASYNASGGTETTTNIYWRWPFNNGDDNADTIDGIAAESYPMKATFTVTQLETAP